MCHRAELTRAAEGSYTCVLHGGRGGAAVPTRATLRRRRNTTRSRRSGRAARLGSAPAAVCRTRRRRRPRAGHRSVSSSRYAAKAAAEEAPALHVRERRPTPGTAHRELPDGCRASRDEAMVNVTEIPHNERLVTITVFSNTWRIPLSQQNGKVIFLYLMRNFCTLFPVFHRGGGET